MLRSPNRLPEADRVRRRAEAAAPTWRDTAIWIALAAVPSGLLIAVTAHISTDVAAVPLFWTMPLAIYLLTFVIVFQTRPFIPHWLVVAVQPAFVLFLVIAILMLPIESIVAADRDPSQRVLRLRADVPWRTCAPPSAAAVPDRLLHVDFVRRHGRRHPDRACCAADLQSRH